jgi:hypothetical protein
LVASEVEAQKEIARLGYEEARLQEAKSMAESTEKLKREMKYLFYNQQPQRQQELQIQKQKLGELKIDGLVVIQL